MEGRGRSELGSAETEKWKYKTNLNTLCIWILIGFFLNENPFESSKCYTSEAAAGLSAFEKVGGLNPMT